MNMDAITHLGGKTSGEQLEKNSLCRPRWATSRSVKHLLLRGFAFIDFTKIQKPSDSVNLISQWRNRRAACPSAQ